jgi:hypothetical protein
MYKQTSCGLCRSERKARRNHLPPAAFGDPMGSCGLAEPGGIKIHAACCTSKYRIASIGD